LDRLSAAGPTSSARSEELYDTIRKEQRRGAAFEERLLFFTKGIEAVG
jgi:hypothetical protein